MQNFANPINITSNEQALSRFNDTVGRVISGRAGFAKSHLVTYTGWQYDPAMLDLANWGLPPQLAIAIGDPTALLSSTLEQALDRGANTASQTKGTQSVMIKNSTLAMGDLSSVSFTRSGSDWIITLNVVNGETRQTKALLGTRFTGSAPIQKGPIHQAMDFGPVIHDHMSADRAFNWVRDTFSMGLLGMLGADPIEVREQTTNARYVMTLDGGGNLKRLQCSYDQVLHIVEINFLGRTFRDNRISTRVTINYDNFDF